MDSQEMQAVALGEVVEAFCLTLDSWDTGPGKLLESLAKHDPPLVLVAAEDGNPAQVAYHALCAQTERLW